MSVGDRLGRLLFIVPYVAARDGVPLAELAEKLGVEPRQIEDDLSLLSLVGRPPLTPDHLIEIFVEDDVVYVELDQSLSRPLRLTHDEARALVLAAKLVGDLGGLGAELDALVARLIEHLNPVDAELVRASLLRIGLWREQATDDGPAATLRAAIEARAEVELEYYSLSSDQQKVYRLQPLGLLNHTGVEYLVALDLGQSGHEKLFRTDRMGVVQATEVHFEPPADVDLEKFRTPKLFFGAPSGQAEVRFAATVARVVRERFAAEQMTVAADGSVTVRLSSSSPAWLMRWVLPFGTAAEIVGPPQERGALGALCREAAAAYARVIS